MARRSHPSVSTPQLMFLLILLARLAGGANSSSISIYWGQNDNEPTLASTCQTGYYGFVNLAYLIVFGNGRTPLLDLRSHSTFLSSDINTCQSLGVKVFLSVSGNIESPGNDTEMVGEYIWNNFLNGSSAESPLGNAVLDGIDFVVASDPPDYWTNLTEYLANKSQQEKKFYLSALPLCHSDPWLGPALKKVLFDYVWVQFFNNPTCEYDGSIDKLNQSWTEWTSSVQAGEFFLGLPASPKAASSGYIDPCTLIAKVLPVVKTSPKYGGVMVTSEWTIDYNNISAYSAAIKACVSKNIPNHLRFAHAEL